MELPMSSSNDAKIRILKNHLFLFYRLMAENNPILDAKFEKIGDLHRCLSGISMPYNNPVIGLPRIRSHWEPIIKEQLDYFSRVGMPFVWLIDANEGDEFKKTLIEYGFKDAGTLQGVMGDLKSAFPIVEMPNGFKSEMVKDLHTLEQFNDLVSPTFGVHGTAKEIYKQFLWENANGVKPAMFHWITRKDGRVVSTLTTLIEGDVVSFWNSATLPEYRRQGLSTALLCLALNDAISKGCRIGISYIMAEGLAYGICKKLGYQTEWQFQAFIAPMQLGSL